MSNLPELPYSLPESLEGKVVVLSDIVGINPIHFADVSREDAAQALTGLVLYWHLDRHERRRVIQHWESLPRPLYGTLQRKLDFTQINRSWGMWSLSTEELLEKKDWLNSINTAAGLLGLGISIKSAADIKKLVNGTPKDPRATLAMVLIGAKVTLNVWEEGKVDDEMANRLRRH